MHPFDRPTSAAFEIEVLVHEGASAGGRHVLRKFPAFIGRGRDVDVRLEDDSKDPTLSRRHLKITLESGRVVVTDLSTNGTWVGQHHLEPMSPHLLEGGEEIWLGLRTMVTIQPASPLGPPASSRVAVRPPASRREAPAHGPPAPPTPTVAPERGEEEAPSVGTGIPLRVDALGRFQVAVRGEPIPDAAWSARKAMVLLAYLVDSRGRPVSAERLGEALWPDAEEGSRQALQTAVSRVRRAFRALSDGSTLPDPIPLDRAGYHVHPAYDVQYDVEAFQTLCDEGIGLRAQGRTEEAARALEQGVALYRGPFLEGHFDEWVHARRRAIDQAHLEALDTLGNVREEQGRADEAARVYRRAVEWDACREQSQAGLIRCLAAAGKREEAARQYQACVRTLRKTLGLGPGPELVALYESLMAGN